MMSLSKKAKMKVSEMHACQAVGVTANGVVTVSDGDAVLVGIKCVFMDGKYVPLSKKIALIPDIFEDISPSDMVVIKRIV
jgi:hypothetical protein